MAPSDGQFVRVLVMAEGGGYTAQMLEMDFAARGRSEDEALRCLARLLIGQARLDRSRGRRPFVGAKPAPSRFWDLWREIALTADDDGPPPETPDAYIINAALKGSSFQLSW